MWKLAFSRLIAALSRFFPGRRGIAVVDLRSRHDDAAGSRFAVLVSGGHPDRRAASAEARVIALTAFWCAFLTLLAYISDQKTSINAALGIIAIGNGFSWHRAQSTETRRAA